VRSQHLPAQWPGHGAGCLAFNRGRRQRGSAALARSPPALHSPPRGNRMSRFYCIVGCLALLLGGCAAPPASKTERICFIPKLINIPYFNACKKGAEQAAQELGIELLYNGPTTTDVNAQIDLVNQWAASRRIDALCIACNDPDLIARTLQDARDRGLAVI